MQPGDTIKPDSKSKTDDADKSAHSGELHVSHDTPDPPAAHHTKAHTESHTKHKTEHKTDPAPENTPAEIQTEPDEVATPWQYNQERDLQSSDAPSLHIRPVSWSASEFIDHEKNPAWFMSLAGMTAGAIVLIYLVTQDVITVVVVGIAAILFGVTAKRKPRTLEYLLDSSGVHIADKSYSYDMFKTFSVLEEGAFDSIQLMPLKRFMPPITLYFPPESEESIVNTLANYLPHEDRTHDPIDRLMRRVRF